MIGNAVQVASLFGVLDLQDSMTPALDRALGATESFSQRVQRVGDGVTQLGGAMTVLTAPITAFGAMGIKAAGDFDSAMAEIAARTGLVGEELEQVRQFALQMGADTVFSGQQAADTFLQLLTSGSSVAEAMEILPSVLNAAAASGGDLGQTADILTDIMAAFGLEADAAAGVVDSLARAAGASSADIASLGQGFGNVGNVARNFGLSVDQTAAILAIFSENGIKGADAGTQLRSMLQNMTRPTEAVQKAWNDLGVSMYDADGNVRSLNVVIAELDAALDQLPIEEQNRLMYELAGSYGIMGLSALRGSISIDEMQQKMQDSASATDVAAAMMDTWNVRLDSLLGSLQTLQIEALTPLMEETLGPFIEQVTQVINGVTDWVRENPQLTSTIVMVAGALAALGPTLLIAGQAISAIGVAIGFLTSPIGLVIAALAAFAAAWATDFGGMRTFIETEVFPRLQQFFGWLGGVWAMLQPGLEALRVWFVEDALPTVVNFIESVALPVFDLIIATISGIWAQIAPPLADFFNWFMANGLPVITNFINTIVIPVIEALINIISSIWSLVEPFVGPFVEGIVGALKTIIGVIDQTIGKIGELMERLGAWQSVQQNANIIGQGLQSGQWNIGDVAGAAVNAIRAEFGLRDSGGRGEAGQPYLIGVGAQPELFVPDSAGTFYPNADRLFGGGGVTVHGDIVIQANSVTEGRSAADGFQARMQELLRMSG